MRFVDQDAWREWLAASHAHEDEAIVEMAKKASGIPSITHPEAVEVALCFGWIDGVRRGVDDQWFAQRFTPRRPQSTWSQLMREKAEELIASGAMQPAGQAEVDRAKADGRWDAAYPAQSKATVPDDLQAALDASPRAAAEFAALDSRNRYAILHRLHNAKRAETRERNVVKFVAMLERGERLH